MAELKNSQALDDETLDEVSGGAGRDIRKPGVKKSKVNIPVTDAGGKKTGGKHPGDKKEKLKKASKGVTKISSKQL